MYGCPDCQERMLDHLYGLLDAAEQAEFLAHLTGCPACQAGAEKARAQQRMFAAAARLPLPPGRFEKPEEEAGPRPVLLPLRPGRRPAPRRWARWAAAAAVLLALGAGTVYGLRAQEDYLTHRAKVRAAETAVADATDAFRKAGAEVDRLAAERDRKMTEMAVEAKARGLRIEVTGPRNLQPGAAIEYQVRAYDGLDRSVDADLSASLFGVRARHEPAAAAKLDAMAKGPGGGGFGKGGAAPAPTPPGPGGPAATAPAPKDAPRADKKGEEKMGEAGKPTAAFGRHALRVKRVESQKGHYKLIVPPDLEFDPARSVAMVVSARRTDKELEAVEDLTLQGKVSITAPVLLTHLTTDKPMYQPGEAVRFRSLTLDRGTLTPPADELRLRYILTPPVGPQRVVAHGLTTLTNGAGVVNGPDGKPVRGIGSGDFVLEPDSAGGEYTLTVTEDAGRFAPVVRRFVVNEYHKPRLDKKLEYNRPTYGPGDEVQAQASAKRADGGPLKKCPVEATLTVDGTALTPVRTATDDDGQAVVQFRLPAKIERGQANLSVLFRDEGTPEPITRPVPVVLNKVDLEFYPEGGDLVAGLPSRVYFQARTPAGKPAQLSGRLLEDGEPTDVTLTTLSDDQEPGVNQGLGVFAFTPKQGRTYAVRVDAPKGVAERKPLPKVQPDGVTLSVEGGVFLPDEEINVKVRSTKGRMFLVGAYCRDTLLDSVIVPQGKTDAVLRPSSPAGGVCRVTAFEVLNSATAERQLVPRAERLVYRHPGARLDVALLPGKKKYAPADRAGISVITTDESERMVPALAQLAIVDRSLLTMADERAGRSMPTHFLLATEVRRPEDLEHADFLLGQHSKAPAVLDLLLGTQGWRRFAEQNPYEFLDRMRATGRPLNEARRAAEDAARFMLLLGDTRPLHADLDQAKVNEVAAEYREKIEAVHERQVKAKEQASDAAREPEYRAAVLALRNYDAAWQVARTAGLIALGLIALVCVVRIYRRSLEKLSNRVYAIGGLLAGALALLLVLTPPDRPTTEPAPAEPNRLAAAIDRFADEEKKARLRDEDADDPGARRPWKEAEDGKAIELGLGAIGRRTAPAKPSEPTATGGSKLAYSRDGVTEYFAGGFGGGTNGRMRFGMGMSDRESARLGDAMSRATGATRGGEAGVDKAIRGIKAERGEGKKEKDKDLDLPVVPLVAREYAHLRPEGLNLAVRSDFAETIYWHPVLVLPDGHADVTFQLPDSVTNFQAAAFAHTLDGRLGAATTLVQSRLPLVVSPKLPTEVTASDRMNMPVAVTSTTTEKQSVKVTVTESLGLQVEKKEAGLELLGEATGRVLLPVRPLIRDGLASITVAAGGDAAKQSVRVVPDGFPVERASSDLLEMSATHAVSLPNDMVPGTLKVRVDAYPSPLADLAKGMEGLLREPSGCFEQTSSTNYPNVLMLDFLREQKKSSPALEGKARGLLERGYKRLISFECENPAQKSKQGFEWFGGTAPPHEALTAYGLMEFTDMARVADVDKAMVERTRSFLLSRKDGKGGFLRNAKATGAFGRASETLTNAYIVWALTETGKDDVALELDTLVRQAEKTQDAYFLSLVALSLTNRDRAKEAVTLLGRVAKAQKPDGSLTAETSITSSGAVDLAIETTSLAVLGWLRADSGAFAKNVSLGVRWVGRQRQGGGAFGSTQATILALKALLAHSRHSPREVKEGEMKLFAGAKEVGKARVAANAEGTVSIDLAAPETVLKAGANKLRVEMSPATNVMPHTLGWSYRALKPAAEAAPLVKLTTKLAKTEVREGETVRLTARVENVSGEQQGMVTAVIGLPAGLSLPENLEQLRGHTKPPADGPALVSAFETAGREVVLYWRSMDKGQVIEVPLDVVARVPGTYRGPASRAYPYYNARAKHWADPLSVKIAE